MNLYFRLSDLQLRNQVGSRLESTGTGQKTKTSFTLFVKPWKAKVDLHDAVGGYGARVFFGGLKGQYYETYIKHPS